MTQVEEILMMRRRTGLFTADQVDGDSGLGLRPRTSVVGMEEN